MNDNIRNGKTAAFKVADLGSNPCSPANMNLYSSIVKIEPRLVSQVGIGSTVRVAVVMSI